MSTKLTNKGDVAFDTLNGIFLFAVVVAIVYPLYYIIIASFSEPQAVNLGRVVFVPIEWTIDGYRELLGHKQLWNGYVNTIVYTVVGTTINLLMTLPAGYALSRADFRARKIIMPFIIFTMLFHGGLIPRYVVIRNLGLLDSIWCIVLPRAVMVFELVIVRSYFENNIPKDFLDAAKIDGQSETGFFLKIALPLSKALMAVLIIRYGITHWNLFFDALIFLRDRSKYPLQLVLRNILLINQGQANSLSFSIDEDPGAAQRLADLLRYTVIIAGSLPFLILYPYLQKFFIQGVLVGGLKG